MAVKPFLLYFQDADCHGYRLVYAEIYEQACDKLKEILPNAEIRNCTIL